MKYFEITTISNKLQMIQLVGENKFIDNFWFLFELTIFFYQYSIKQIYIYITYMTF